jgi:hypothetical protein
VAGGSTLSAAVHAPLPELIDVDATVVAVRAVLDRLGLPAGACIRSATAVDGKPGERLLVRYDVAGPRPDHRTTVFGKLYADPTAAARVHETMSHLWDVFANSAPRATVPGPVALVPELGMVVYVPAPGTPLDTIIDRAEAPAALGRAGAWLGYLHASAVPLDRRFMLATELLNAAAWGALVAAFAPAVASAVTDLCLRLRERSDEVAFEEATPIHKDFHPGHVIVNGSVAVVDFDEARLGDPAFDVAHFCAYLHLLALRRGLGARLAALEAAFIDGYTDRTGWVADGRFGFFRAYTAVKIAKQLATTRGLRPRPSGADLDRQLREVVEEGARWVEAGS